MKMDDLGVTMGNPHEEKDNPPVKKTHVVRKQRLLKFTMNGSESPLGLHSMHSLQQPKHDFSKTYSAK